MTDKNTITQKEKARRKRILFWTVVVIIINLLQILFKNWFTQALAGIGTVYVLYQLVVYDNKKNRLSRKYYDWRGKPLNK